MLFHTGAWTLYGTVNGWHYMAPKGEIETHTLPMDEVSDVKKPSIDSRFSVEAHGDPETLKKEFRIFAKQYHPGTADIPEATGLFQDISAEYEQLQNYLSS